jgi:hypothetical protein
MRATRCPVPIRGAAQSTRPRQVRPGPPAVALFPSTCVAHVRGNATPQLKPENNSRNAERLAEKTFRIRSLINLRPARRRPPTPAPWGFLVGCLPRQKIGRPMATGDEYRVKAADMSAQARREIRAQARFDLHHLALFYLRLADQADRRDMYPAQSHEASQTLQQQQQPQPKSDPDK